MTYVGKLGASTVYGSDAGGRIGGVAGGGGGATYDSYSNLGAPGTPGELFIPSDGPLSFVADDGLEWRPLLPGAGVGTRPPVIAGWSQQMGSGGAADSAGGILCSFASNGSTHGVKGITYPLPAASNYTIVAGVQILMYPGVNGTDFAPVGCGWTDGTAANSTWILSEFVQYNSTMRQSQESYAGSTATPSAISSIQNPYTFLLAAGNIVFWKLVDDGTNRFAYVGGNRHDWQQVYQASRTTIVTPTHFALGCNPYANAATARLVHYEAVATPPP